MQTAKTVILGKKEEVIMLCALLYNKRRERACKTKNSVPVGILKRNNASTYNPFKMPFIADVEPIICVFCIRPGKLGQSLTKTTVIEFAEYKKQN
jgi:hypothetical protein